MLNTEEFKKEINSLNMEQKKVVNEIERNILLLASAGTGKTKTLALRIANIIQNEKASAEKILCLTFTNRACKEMKKRIIDTIGKNGMDVVVGTFHSFCFDVIKAEAKRNTDIASDFIIFDEEDCKEIIKEIALNGLSSIALQNFINYVKEFSLKIDDYNYTTILESLINNNLDKLRDLCNLKIYNNKYQVHIATLNFIQQYGDKFVERYNQILHERHGMDFNDLLIKVSRLFKSKNIFSRWSEKFKYIHIDEVQDTSMVEYTIISKLFSNNNVMICGDYFQTIYEWRGSNPDDIFNSYKEQLSPITIVFNENYRATQKLLQASHGYLENTYGNKLKEIYNSKIKSQSSIEGNNIRLKKAYNIREEARWIFNKIKELELEDVSKVAILTRNNNLNIEFSKIFDVENKDLPREEKLDFLIVDDFKFFRRQEIKDIIAYIKFIINKFDNNSLKRIICRNKIGIGEKALEIIESKEIRNSGVRLSDYVNINTHKYGEPYQLLLNEIERGNVVVFDVESTGVNTTEDEIIQIAGIKINKYGEVLDEFERKLRPNRSVGQSEMVHGFSDEYLKENGEDSTEVLIEFLDFIEGAIVIGHNVSYDISILTSQLERLNLPRPNFLDYYDTLDISRRFYPNLVNHKLETLGEKFQSEIKSDHDAMNDILCTKDVLISMIEEAIKPNIMQRVASYEKYLKNFTQIYKEIIDFREKSINLRPHELIAEIVKNSNLISHYKKDEIKMENMRYFYKVAESMDDDSLSCTDSLNELLKITSLSNSEMDRMLEKYPKIPIITIHQAKGAEFDYVFLAGLQEYKFPTYQSIKNQDFEEEERVFYVAITRAKKELYLSWAENERDNKKQMCRFIDNIPKEYIENISF